MPRSGDCKICNHQHAGDIDAELAAVATSGKSLKAIGRQFSVSPTTLGRHQKHCLPQVPETERATPPPPRSGISPELCARITAANDQMQNASGSALTVAIRQFAQAITDAITDNGAPQP